MRRIAAALLLAAFGTASAAPTRAAERPWPAGTELIPFEYRNAQVLVNATLTSPSGHEVSGLLLMDTGAPVLVVSQSVWRALNVDTLDMGWGVARIIRRPLAALTMGSARVTDLAIGGVVVDSVLDRDVLGFFPPSFYQDRAIVVDYEGRRLAIVNRRLAFATPDTSASRGGSSSVQARVNRSRSRYTDILGPGAVALPFRRFEGGRLLVSARLVESSRDWQSPPLTLSPGSITRATSPSRRPRPTTRTSLSASAAVRRVP